MTRPLRAGAHPERCPTCGDAMSLPIRGRKTGTWIRTCTAEACKQQTITTTAPAPVAQAAPIVGRARPVDVRLPFGPFNARALADRLDWKARAAGEDQ